ncbi:hypothetical protein Gpo141_00012324 [Globisporangium polare]
MRRDVRHLVAVATLVTLSCSIALLGLESSSMGVGLHLNAIHTAFLRGSAPVNGTDEVELGELMTPELMEQIASQESDCLKPMHVHLLWIGDIDKAPTNIPKYTEMGYNLTVHTSAEDVLDGFLPHVIRAFKLSVPNVVGYDFLKFAMAYKFGGLTVDADTVPMVPASEIQWPAGCDVVLGKEARAENWEQPSYRPSGANTYGLSRPFQILNWAMAANKPRNPHVKQLMEMAMMHFLGLRDMGFNFIQDISGSGLMTDYVAMLHEQEGRRYQDVYNDERQYIPVQGLCLTDGYLHGKWIFYEAHGTWKDGWVANH